MPYAREALGKPTRDPVINSEGSLVTFHAVEMKWLPLSLDAGAMC